VVVRQAVPGAEEDPVRIVGPGDGHGQPAARVDTAGDHPGGGAQFDLGPAVGGQGGGDVAEVGDVVGVAHREVDDGHARREQPGRQGALGAGRADVFGGDDHRVPAPRGGHRLVDLRRVGGAAGGEVGGAVAQFVERPGQFRHGGAGAV